MNSILFRHYLPLCDIKMLEVHDVPISYNHSGSLACNSCIVFASITFNNVNRRNSSTNQLSLCHLFVTPCSLCFHVYAVTNMCIYSIIPVQPDRQMRNASCSFGLFCVLLCSIRFHSARFFFSRSRSIPNEVSALSTVLSYMTMCVP